MKGLTELTSRNNEKIKQASGLLKASERKKSGLFLIEGARLCEDAALNGADIESVFVTPEALEKYAALCQTIIAQAKNGYLINESVARKLSDTDTSQQVFCVCRQQQTLLLSAIDTNELYLFCDNLQNPDNLGAIVRSAEALGAKGLILNGGCDRYSPKALRASMGALLRFPTFKTENGVSDLTYLKQSGMKIYATMLCEQSKNISDVDKTGGVVLVIGNEGNGVSDEIADVCTQKIIIPMKGRAQSLNAAVAASIALWEFVRM